MQCPHCQHENPSGMKFCGECGARLETACPACGAANLPENKFCGECGAALTRAPKFSSPQSYTPTHLAEKILISKNALEGERKQVTVLFADMKGSMELLADRDPEEARKLLDPVIEHMMEAVHRYEGTVSNLMGDGIMALFGAPVAHEDHAVRGCYAALRMQESVRKYAEAIRRTEGVPIQIRAGLNSGEVVVGAIGNDLKMDYTAIGQTVHMASRMEQMAMPGSIMITNDTLRLAEGYVQVKSLGQPLLVVFEDLHWVDAQTQAFLDSLVDSLPAARFLLLVNYRPEYQHNWGSKTYYSQIRVDPLPPESAMEVLGALLGDRPALQPLKDLLIARTEGTPFFLEESVRTLVETNVLTGGRGNYELAKSIDSIQVPASVQAVLAARIDRLASSTKQLLQCASVIGKDFPFVLLQSVSERSEEELRTELSYLQAAEFVYETRLFPDQEYTFKHALTHEVAYGSLLQERRRALHARIVAAIEQLYSERLGEQVERLAHHAARGELWDKAVEYLHLAGKAQDPALLLQAHHELWANFTELGELTSARTHLEQGFALYDPRKHNQHAFLCGGHDPGVCCRYHAADVLWLLGYPDQALGRSRESLALARELSHASTTATALSFAAWFEQRFGERQAVQGHPSLDGEGIFTSTDADEFLASMAPG